MLGSYQYTLDNAGNRLSVTENRYLYTGQQFDAATGQYSLRARYYDPGVGRFASRDVYPYNLQDPFELNRYGYVAGNPVNAFDPSGYQSLISYALNKINIGIRATGQYLGGERAKVGAISAGLGSFLGYFAAEVIKNHFGLPRGNYAAIALGIQIDILTGGVIGAFAPRLLNTNQILSNLSLTTVTRAGLVAASTLVVAAFAGVILTLGGIAKSFWGDTVNGNTLLTSSKQAIVQITLLGFGAGAAGGFTNGALQYFAGNPKKLFGLPIRPNLVTAFFIKALSVSVGSMEAAIRSSSS